MITKILSILKSIKENIENLKGITVSNTTISFENLVKIFPIGLESKNFIFDFNKLLTIF